MANTNAEAVRHPLAIAWDDWLASKEGQECADFSNLTGAVYLENRLHSAFSAGASTAESNLAEKVLKEIKRNSHGVANDVSAFDMGDRLRDLFTRLNVKIEEG